jgi:multimeric flavodoxin WrbA
MKAVILNGASAGAGNAGTLSIVKNEVAGQLRDAGWDVDIVELSEKKIAGCLGCYGCWFKTPGMCVQNDDGREVARAIIQSDLSIYLTPITFGGYSSELKKARDRLIGNALPYFVPINGEIHHPRRYDKDTSMAVIGILRQSDYDEANTFKLLFERNMLNAQPKYSALGIIREGEAQSNVRSQIKQILQDVGVAA